MPTRRGWTLCAAVALLAVLGRLLGVMEMIVAAATGSALLVAAVAYVRATPVRVKADRVVRPPRCHAGATADVEVTLRNAAPGKSGQARRTPTLGVQDPFGSAGEAGRRWARFRVAPIEPGQALTATYQLPGEERGVYELGPLAVRLEDPFGLAARQVAEAAPLALVVYPRIEVLDPLFSAAGNRSDQVRPIAHAASVDGDLDALREYHLGDDLRRVHWRATAKRNEVMIRQDDVPVRNAATVVLDLRAGVHSSASLETAISAAASVVHSAWRRRWPVRLVTSDGADSGLAAGHAHMEAILERLALARTQEGTVPAPLPAPSGRWSRDGMLAVITTATVLDRPATGAPAGAVGPILGGRGGRADVLVIVDQQEGGQQATPGAERLPWYLARRPIHVSTGQPLAPAWARAVGAGHRRRVDASSS
ncbi:MAG: DUF58 domain-containing protein [Actinomycetota bacterium]|nr:DUF58 domain-containing protein [Actinomycetota bacterium]